MPRQIYIHNGHNKTGSTTIQRWLFANKEQLSKRGIGCSSIDSNLSFIMMQWARFLVGEADENAAIAELLSEIRRSQDTFVISAESLCRMSAQKIAALYDALASECDVIQLIGYVRPPRSLIGSWAQQRLKRGFPLRATGPGALPGPAYQDMFQPWISCLGHENCRISLFHHGSFSGNSLLRDFASKLGVADCVSEDAAKTTLNRSISMTLGNFLAAFNERISDLSRETRQAICNQLLINQPKDSGPRYRLPAGIEQAVVDRHSEQIAWMEDLLDISFTKLDDVPTADQNLFDHTASQPEFDLAITFLARVTRHGI